MEAKASAKYLQGSSHKARLVVDMIRGKNVNEALAILQFTNKRAAGHIEKCLRSAIANATESAEKANVAVDPDELWVKLAYVDDGPTKKRFRFRPAPQGRAYRERRHFCHVTVHLSSEEREEARGGKAKKGGSDKQSARDARGAKKTAGKGAAKAEAKPAAEAKTRKRDAAAKAATPKAAKKEKAGAPDAETAETKTTQETEE
jgi:large subunit ribosomal protein L22